MSVLSSCQQTFFYILVDMESIFVHLNKVRVTSDLKYRHGIQIASFNEHQCEFVK